MPLGFDPSLLVNAPVDREYRQFMASSLQQLGKQVSEGIRQIATNRQLRQLGDEIKQVDPQSPFFPQEMAGIVTRYPLAASDRRGMVALNLLGNSHKNWLSQQLKQAMAQRNERPVTRKDVSTKNPQTSDKPPKGPTFAQETKAQEYESLMDLRTKEEKMRTLADDARSKYGAESEVVKQIEGNLARFQSQIPKRAPSKAALDRHLQVYRKRFGPALNNVGANAAMPDPASFTTQEELPMQGGGTATITAQAVEPEALIPVSSRPIDRKSAADFLKQAGGDRNKARELAKQAGFLGF